MLVHVPYSMPILRARQPRGGEVLQRLRRSIAPSTAPCIVRALRDGESRSSDRLLLVPRPVAGAQRRARSRPARRRSLHVFASPALSSDRRNGGSRGACRRWLGACRRWLLHLPPTFARRRASGAGFIGRDALADEPKSASADNSAGLTSLATSPPGTPLALPVRAAANQPRADRQPVKSQEAKASEPEPLRAEVCTEAAATLGLCATKPAQKKDRETAAVEAAPKRPQATDAGAQEPPHPQTCTEGVAALGLCTPKPIQRRE